MVAEGVGFILVNFTTNFVEFLTELVFNELSCVKYF